MSARKLSKRAAAMIAANRNAAIVVHEATEQNLQSLSCRLPRSALTVVTGPSGSGKSSLVFGVLYRAAIRGAGSPQVGALSVTGVSPAVAIGIERGGRRDRRMVAALSGAYELLRALFLLEGTRHCPRCGEAIAIYTVDDILAALSKQTAGFISVLRKRPWAEVGGIDELIESGISRCWRDGRIVRLDELDPAAIGPELCLVLDTISPQARGREPRLRDAIASAADAGDATFLVGLSEQLDAEGQLLQFATLPKCTTCGGECPELDVDHFDYLKPAGACPRCAGQGTVVSEHPRSDVLAALSFVPEELCDSCGGARVRPESAALALQGHSLGALLRGSFTEALAWAEGLRVADFKGLGAKILLPLRARLEVLTRLDVGYLPLMRAVQTLSAGELQRVKLAADLSKPLGGLLYLIDEPTTGLSAPEVACVVEACRDLVARGSTVIAVEHDPHFIAASDYVVELGPGSGVHGGRLIAAAPVKEFLAGGSPTALAIRRLSQPPARPSILGEVGAATLFVRGMHRYSLQHVDMRIPLQRLVVVSGVSGSGKTTAVLRTLVPLVSHLLHSQEESGEALSDATKRLFKVESLSGIDKLVVVVDASVTRPYLGGRSTVASAAGVLSPLRELFARTIEARTAGLTPREFSFSSPSGWCEVCQGRGYAPDALLDPEFRGAYGVCAYGAFACTACEGSRLAPRARSVRYRGRNLTEVLDLTIDEAALNFRYVPRLRLLLPRLQRLGLGYLRLSQATRSLSRGEQQRLRLLPYIGRAREEGGALLVFDEPTKGLHLDEVTKLVALLRTLTVQGNTVVVIEHNPELLRAADYLIEFGPGAGQGGGRIIDERWLSRPLEMGVLS